jgi:hypothetical protein
LSKRSSKSRLTTRLRSGPRPRSEITIA